MTRGLLAGGIALVLDPGNGVLALMGSGETSPTMVTAHRRLAALAGSAPRAVILQTPYGFQVNTADISERAREYFSRSVGLETSLAPEAAELSEPEAQRVRDLVHDAQWVFAGPGSPSYALERWEALRLRPVLAGRIRAGGAVTVLASAAACTAGLAALPVYEIYKAGRPPCWLDGLDLLGALGLPVAVIPHYDNAEGGTYDTRFCYLGESRLARLEEELPPDAAVLGIDEHTAVVFDLDAGRVQVWGRGVMTVRRAGASTTVPGGAELSLAELQALVRGTAAAELRTRHAAPRPAGAGDRAGETGRAVPLPEAVADARRRWEGACGRADGAGMVAAVLDLETVIAAWAGDTEEDLGTDWARGELRELVARLGEPAGQGLAEPDRTLRLLAGPLVDLRHELREQGLYALADRLRSILAAAGIQLRDTGQTTEWSFDKAHAASGASGPGGPASSSS